ncbi:hypothetical protein FK178_07665 [Antarcticibacterium arcticum]|uniref:Uncharacterized protein n=1 Tax=Antarcticibacterium arcticum TaxID=2585771 RepID=A0A5B8YP26_9FLAO|nr:hypothetical protein [Antarcticibacterium arcticum]QED37609.1 hypothetical protein FK178_07665 [Antarcticibacterium arcticum]
MKKLLYVLFLVTIVSCGKSSEEISLSQEVDSLKTEITALHRANDTLSDHLLKRSYVTLNYPAFFDSIAEPEEYILQELQQRPGLISKKAVLGGTMRFTRVTFINEDLLVAEFEDGHIMGKTVFRYRLTRNGELGFTNVCDIEY